MFPSGAPGTCDLSVGEIKVFRFMTLRCLIYRVQVTWKPYLNQHDITSQIWGDQDFLELDGRAVWVSVGSCDRL